MKRLAIIVFVGVSASCAVPVTEKNFDAKEHEVTYLFPEITVKPDNRAEPEKTKKVKRPDKQMSMANPCADIDTGSLRQDINMKLDCITEQLVRYR